LHAPKAFGEEVMVPKVFGIRLSSTALNRLRAIFAFTTFLFYLLDDQFYY
jgi:hypothetical protein